jgi:hypothetical protein
MVIIPFILLLGESPFQEKKGNNCSPDGKIYTIRRRSTRRLSLAGGIKGGGSVTANIGG